MQHLSVRLADRTAWIETFDDIRIYASRLFSLAMWGFHDHSLSMRKALNETLITSKPNNALYRRWRWTQSVQNKKVSLPDVYEIVERSILFPFSVRSSLFRTRMEGRMEEFTSFIVSRASDLADEIVEFRWFQHNEWRVRCRRIERSCRARKYRLNSSKSSTTLVSSNTGGSIKSTTQSTRQYYESLEEFHVYVLANNIRRPIIVFSDTILRTNDGEAISPIEFGGIYLPLGRLAVNSKGLIAIDMCGFEFCRDSRR
jgi:OTU domain-containing protein 7